METLNQYRLSQIQSVAESMGIVNDSKYQLLEAISKFELTPEVDISAVFDEEVMVVKECLHGTSLGELIGICGVRLKWHRNRENQLLSDVKLAVSALTIDFQIDGDVNTWDMNKLADTGYRLNSNFITDNEYKLQFDDTFARWECGNDTYSFDSDGYPSGEDGNRLDGEFITALPHSSTRAPPLFGYQAKDLNMAKSLSIRTGNFARTYKKSLSRMPQSITKKAALVADQICQGGESYQRFQCRHLGVNRKVIAVKLGQKHRLLIADTDEGMQP
jgi:hypothetical protein